jgi:hypothetical protein
LALPREDDPHRRAASAGVLVTAPSADICAVPGASIPAVLEAGTLPAITPGGHTPGAGLARANCRRASSGGRNLTPSSDAMILDPSG